MIDVLARLERSRGPLGAMPEATAPGVYAIFLASTASLPEIDVPSSGVIYVGLSTDLAKRNHFLARHSGFHSPRRSLGAILKATLSLYAIPRAPSNSPTNVSNFSFTDDGEERLTRWMKDHLEYATLTFDGDIGRLEKDLIRAAEPPLNLTGWRNPQRARISALRELCRREAKNATGAR